jgi:hypothetical protein
MTNDHVPPAMALNASLVWADYESAKRWLQN